MMNHLAGQILASTHEVPEGAPITAKGLLHLGSRAAVDQALSRLAKRGKLLRAGRGIYVRAVEGPFGARPPEPEKVVRAVAEQKGERVAESGAAAANALGLTEQVPARLVYLTSGRGQRLQLGKQVVELKHAPGWQLSLPETRAGKVVRALLWLGPERVETAAAQLEPTLSAADRRALAAAPNTRMPDWLARSVARLAHG